jgi:hypothetical protein
MVTATQIERSLIDFTVFNSRFEDIRNYIGLSKIIEPAEELAKLYNSPISASLEDKVKCYKGYQEEADIVRRLKCLYFERITYKEIIAYGGLVKGHPDCWLDDCPVDVKSFARDEYMPTDRVHKRIYWQMQAYLLYSNSAKGFYVCESRESGLIKVIGANPNPVVQKMIDDKIKQVMEMLTVKNNGKESRTSTVF